MRNHPYNSTCECVQCHLGRPMAEAQLRRETEAAKLLMLRGGGLRNAPSAAEHIAQDDRCPTCRRPW